MNHQSGEWAALRRIAEGTRGLPREDFFGTLVERLAVAIGTRHAFVAQWTSPRELRTLAYWCDGTSIANVAFDPTCTPCAPIIDGGSILHDSPVAARYPHVGSPLGSHIGAPLKSGTGRILGALCTFDESPLADDPRTRLILEIFAVRAAAELERLALEQERARLRTHNAYLDEELRSLHPFATFIGASPGLMNMLDNIRPIAAATDTVLITGESGTGKEFIARAIHSAGSRADQPFIKVDCARLPTDLLVSELFGQQRSASGGALQSRIGRLELAQGGTLFLDEIGDLSAKPQIQLLRLLQQREYVRVGGTQSIKADVRVLAASNRDLRKRIHDGDFREDLFQCLAGFPIHLPPLRERRSDIPLLAHYFVQKHAARIGRRIEAVDPASLRRLSLHSWPGNIRELEIVVERALFLSEAPVLRIDLDTVNAANEDTVDLDSVQRDHIRRVLREAGWVIEGRQGAAARLGLKPGTLRHRMNKLGIRRAKDR